MPRTKPDLAMNWSRTEQQLVVRLQGASPEDGRALVQHLGQFLFFDLETRGYDLQTLRFSIRKAKAGQQPETDEENIA
jgi:hypothetical protein